MKKLFLALALLVSFAVEQSPGQCITSISYDTTSSQTFIYFTMPDTVNKVILFACDTTGTDSTDVTKTTGYYLKSPIILGKAHLPYGKTYTGIIKGYWGVTLECVSLAFTFKMPTNVTSQDSCTTPTCLKTTITAGSAYLTWSGAHASSWTVYHGVDNGSTVSYSAVTGVAKAGYTLPVIPGKRYKWYVKADCAVLPDKTSEIAAFAVPK